MKKLCILIPTRNRAEYIKEWIDTMAGALAKYDVDVHVFDSSVDNLTKKTILEADNDHFFYHLFQNEDNSPDAKVHFAYGYLKEQYEYIWLCGDGIIIELDMLFQKFPDILERGSHVISLCDSALNINQVKFDNDCNTAISFTDYARYFLHAVTLYGSTILSSAFVRRLLDETNFNQWRMSYFYPQLAIVSLLDENMKISVYLGNFLINSKSKQKYGNGVSNEKNFLYIWTIKWKTVIDFLPERYAEIKMDLYRANWIFFTVKRLIRFRMDDNINLKLAKKYWKELKYVSCGRGKIVFVSLVPKFIWKMIYRIYRGVKKVS